MVKFIPYNEVYGALGLIPLGVFWIYLSWFIVLFGLQLTFTTQHLPTLDAAEIAAAQKREEYFIANDLTMMNIVGEIASAFETGDGAVEAAAISSKLDIPAEFAEKILVASGLDRYSGAGVGAEGRIPAGESPCEYEAVRNCRRRSDRRVLGSQPKVPAGLAAGG